MGQLQSLVDDRFGAVRLGLLRGHESSSHRRDRAKSGLSTPSADRPLLTEYDCRGSGTGLSKAVTEL